MTSVNTICFKIAAANFLYSLNLDLNIPFVSFSVSSIPLDKTKLIAANIAAVIEIAVTAAATSIIPVGGIIEVTNKNMLVATDWPIKTGSSAKADPFDKILPV